MPAENLHTLDHLASMNGAIILIGDIVHFSNHEFYHKQLKSGVSELPRIFGMTASPIKSKGGKFVSTLSKNIRELMTLMHSKTVEPVSSIEIGTPLWGSSASKIVKNFSAATVLTLKSCIPSDGARKFTLGYSASQYEFIRFEPCSPH